MKARRPSSLVVSRGQLIVCIKKRAEIPINALQKRKLPILGMGPTQVTLNPEIGQLGQRILISLIWLDWIGWNMRRHTYLRSTNPNDGIRNRKYITNSRFAWLAAHQPFRAGILQARSMKANSLMFFNFYH